MELRSYEFIEWREQFISQERGSRVVHYYLEDASGSSFLAVIGTERSLRHMLYVVSEDFAKLVGSGREGSASSALLKWRSRREAVDWLTSFLPKKNFPRDISNSPTNDRFLSPEKMVTGMTDVGSFSYRPMDQFSCSLKSYNSDIVWSGAFWLCAKQLRHYQAFCRNGTTISNHSFVLVMSEDEENCYLAYLEDMYENKKGQKKVKVRWFHRHQEVVGAIPPPKPHPKEAFITPYSQVISAECVDDLATVLTPDHYDKCLSALQHAFPDGIYVCYRQYNKNKFKSFDVGSLSGYSDQPILSCLETSSVFEEDYDDFGPSNAKHGTKRIRNSRGRDRLVGNNFRMDLPGHINRRLSSQSVHQNLRSGLPGRKSLAVKFIGPRPVTASPFKVGDKIESLCQDSGIRGCWFRCTVVRLKQKRLKIRYDDIQTEDGCENLEEWVPAYRLAAPDKLGMRFSGRLTVRPCRISDNLGDNNALEIGFPVDAWWNDGWWEGVVIGNNSCGDDGLQVYFPGEGLTLVCNAKNLRISKEWAENKWVDIQAKPDVLSAISAVSPSTKLSANSFFIKGSDSGGSATSEQKISVELKQDATEEEMQAADVLTGLLESSNHVASVNSQEEAKLDPLYVKGMDIELDVGNAANS